MMSTEQMVQTRHSKLGIFIIIIVFMDLARTGNIKYYKYTKKK